MNFPSLDFDKVLYTFFNNCNAMYGVSGLNEKGFVEDAEFNCNNFALLLLFNMKIIYNDETIGNKYKSNILKLYNKLVK